MVCFSLVSWFLPINMIFFHHFSKLQARDTLVHGNDNIVLFGNNKKSSTQSTCLGVEIVECAEMLRSNSKV